MILKEYQLGTSIFYNAFLEGYQVGTPPKVLTLGKNVVDTFKLNTYNVIVNVSFLSFVSRCFLSVSLVLGKMQFTIIYQI